MLAVTALRLEVTIETQVGTGSRPSGPWIGQFVPFCPMSAAQPANCLPRRHVAAPLTAPVSSSVRTGQAMTLTRWIIAARAWSSLSGASQNSEKIGRQAAGIASALANDHFGEAAVRNRAAVGSGSLLLKPSQLVSDLFRSSYADAYTLPAGGFAARAL